jgi:hypothetical protein
LLSLHAASLLTDTDAGAGPTVLVGIMLRRIIHPWLTVIPAVFLMSSGPARAESVDDGGAWFAFFGQGDLCDVEDCDETLHPAAGRIKWWFDGHLRFLDDTDGFHQSIVRPGIGWSLTEKTVLWAGYGWIETTPVSGDTFTEHRIWQQATWSDDFGDVTFALRSRLEQRFLETGDDTGLRFRQLVRAQHNLPSSPRLLLVAWDEAFFHLNDTDWGARTGFDQNRLFVGFGFKHKADSPWRTEIGYLNQFIDNAAGSDRQNHILSVNFYR